MISSNKKNPVLLNGVFCCFPFSLCQAHYQYTAGFYMVRFMQGEQTKQLKLIKLSE